MYEASVSWLHQNAASLRTFTALYRSRDELPTRGFERERFKCIHRGGTCDEVTTGGCHEAGNLRWAHFDGDSQAWSDYCPSHTAEGMASNGYQHGLEDSRPGITVIGYQLFQRNETAHERRRLLREESCDGRTA